MRRLIASLLIAAASLGFAATADAAPNPYGTTASTTDIAEIVDYARGFWGYTGPMAWEIADIDSAGYAPGGKFIQIDTSIAADDKARICTVAGHEEGHAIFDLEHTSDTASLMYPSITYWQPCVARYGRESALFIARGELPKWTCKTRIANASKMFFRFACKRNGKTHHVNIQWQRSVDGQLVTEIAVGGRSRFS